MIQFTRKNTEVMKQKCSLNELIDREDRKRHTFEFMY